jgi:hypothetical protein
VLVHCPGGGMVDAVVLEATVERRRSSSLLWGTILKCIIGLPNPLGFSKSYAGRRTGLLLGYETGNRIAEGHKVQGRETFCILPELYVRYQRSDGVIRNVMILSEK